jgi:hypothetical protein
MSEMTKAAPAIGPWQDSCEDGCPDGTEYVLGFYRDNDCVKTKVVYCVLTCVGNKVTNEEWFDIDNDEVDVPDCWAEITYPEEDDA